MRYRFLNAGFEFIIGDNTFHVNLESTDNQSLIININELTHCFHVLKTANKWYVQNEEFGISEFKQKERFPEKLSERVIGGYESPMPSQVVKVLVKPGELVNTGDGLVVLSSMKMENTIEAIEDGKVEDIYVKTGDHVDTGFVLLEIK